MDTRSVCAWAPSPGDSSRAAAARSSSRPAPRPPAPAPPPPRWAATQRPPPSLAAAVCPDRQRSPIETPWLGARPHTARAAPRCWLPSRSGTALARRSAWEGRAPAASNASSLRPRPGATGIGIAEPHTWHAREIGRFVITKGLLPRHESQTPRAACVAPCASTTDGQTRDHRCAPPTTRARAPRWPR